MCDHAIGIYQDDVMTISEIDTIIKWNHYFIKDKKAWIEDGFYFKYCPKCGEELSMEKILTLVEI